MLDPIKCPICGLWSPPHSSRCDCGHVLEAVPTPAMLNPPLNRRRGRILRALTIALVICPVLFLPDLSAFLVDVLHVVHLSWLFLYVPWLTASDGNAPLLITGSWLAAAWCYQRARRYSQLSAEEAMRKDSRPPILYLREFISDFDTGTSVRSYEEYLSRILRDYGPPVCLGDPSNTLAPLGFNRLYVSNEDWQDRILELLPKCQLVVINSDTAGAAMRWEVAQCAKLSPSKVLILGTYGYGDFLHLCRDLMPGLPEVSGGQFPGLQGHATLRWLQFAFFWLPDSIVVYLTRSFGSGVVTFDHRGHGRWVELLPNSMDAWYVLSGGARRESYLRWRKVLSDVGLVRRPPLVGRLSQNLPIGLMWLTFGVYLLYRLAQHLDAPSLPF